MGDGSNYSRIKRISVYTYSATSASMGVFEIIRLSTVGTGGSSVTPSPHDTSDTYGGGAMTLPSSKGTEGASLARFALFLNAGTPTGHGGFYVWEPSPSAKPIIFGTSTASGIALKNIAAVTGGVVEINIEFSTTSYL